MHPAAVATEIRQGLIGIDTIQKWARSPDRW